MKPPENEALELAAQVADLAGGDAATSREDRPLDERTTWDETAKDPYRRALDETAKDPYRRALDEIALLVELRQASEGPPSSEPSKEESDANHWGPFELVERLGGGASGEVYKARDTHLGHHVALKLFHALRLPAVDLDTLLVEGRQHALVKHPNVAVIHGADEYGGRIGIWMEYIDGATLQELVERDGSFGAAETVNVGRELCAALAAVHQRGLTHGDIKAQNVMREKGGRIVLMDFSSSRPVQVEDEGSGLAGTPIYMAPELFDGGTPDFRSDIYALGVLLFYLVTGRHPYEGKNLRELRLAVARAQPLLLEDLRPDLPAELVQTLHRAIAWSADDRFQSAGEFQRALRGSMKAREEDGVEPATGALSREGKDEDLSNLVRTTRFVTNAAIVTAFLALLGYANELQFNVVLHVPENFTDYSFAGAVVVGLRSLAITLVLGVIEVVIIAVLWGLLTVAGGARAARGVAGRVGDYFRRLEFERLATGFALVTIASFAFALVHFSDLLSVFVALGESSSSRGIDMSLLRRGCGDLYSHIRFFLTFSQVILATTLGWFVLFRILRPAGELSLNARFMKWLTALAIVLGSVVMASPWRLLFASESRTVEVADVKGYIVAEKDDAWFVYSPQAGANEEYMVTARDDPRVQHRGEAPEYIFGEENCKEEGTK